MKNSRLVAIALLFGFTSCTQEQFSTLPTPLLTNNNIPNISCTVGTNGPAVTRVYPTSCLVDPGLPADASGFEMNNLTRDHISLDADDPINGSKNGVFAYIEIASYVQPDTIVIMATSATGAQTQLLDICNYSTDTISDPTKPHGQVRPFSDTILQFIVWIPVGTANITVSVDENTPYNSGSPTYIGMWNLNEFQNSIDQVPTSGVGTDTSYNFRPQVAPLSPYNDMLDKNNPNYPTYCVGSP